MSWKVIGSNSKWMAIAASNDGSYILGSQNLMNGEVMQSTDGGNTWKPVSPIAPTEMATWSALALSSDGKFQLAGWSPLQLGTKPKIFTSNDFGSTWTQASTFPNDYLQDVAINQDGSQMLACGRTDAYISKDSGATWNALHLHSLSPDTTFTCSSVASSGDGQTLLTNNRFGSLLMSQDGGNTFSAIPNTQLYPTRSDGMWQSVSMTPDGKVMAAAFSGGIMTSYDSGHTWSQQHVPASTMLPPSLMGIAVADTTSDNNNAVGVVSTQSPGLLSSNDDLHNWFNTLSAQNAAGRTTGFKSAALVKDGTQAYAIYGGQLFQSNPTLATSSSGGSSTSVAAAIGIAFAGVFVVGIVAAGAFFYRKKTRPLYLKDGTSMASKSNMRDGIEL